MRSAIVTGFARPPPRAMSAAAIARMNRELRKEGYPGNGIERLNVARELVHDGFQQIDDLEGAEMEKLTSAKSMNGPQLEWFTELVRRAERTNMKRRKL